MTVECGHTFCVGCLPKSGKCVDCSEDVSTEATAVSIVLKDLVGKVQDADRQGFRHFFGEFEVHLRDLMEGYDVLRFSIQSRKVHLFVIFSNKKNSVAILHNWKNYFH